MDVLLIGDGFVVLCNIAETLLSPGEKIPTGFETFLEGTPPTRVEIVEEMDERTVPGRGTFRAFKVKEAPTVKSY